MRSMLNDDEGEIAFVVNKGTTYQTIKSSTNIGYDNRTSHHTQMQGAAHSMLKLHATFRILIIDRHNTPTVHQVLTTTS